MPDSRDAVDLGHLRETISSKGWAIIHQRLLEMLEVERARCEKPAADVMFHQGQVAALRAVLAVPAILSVEIESALK